MLLPLQRATCFRLAPMREQVCRRRACPLSALHSKEAWQQAEHRAELEASERWDVPRTTKTAQTWPRQDGRAKIVSQPPSVPDTILSFFLLFSPSTSLFVSFFSPLFFFPPFSAACKSSESPLNVGKQRPPNKESRRC